LHSVTRHVATDQQHVDHACSHLARGVGAGVGRAAAEIRPRRRLWRRLATTPSDLGQWSRQVGLEPKQSLGGAQLPRHRRKRPSSGGQHHRVPCRRGCGQNLVRNDRLEPRPGHNTGRAGRPKCGSTRTSGSAARAPRALDAALEVLLVRTPRDVPVEARRCRTRRAVLVRQAVRDRGSA
jgi:hypothetical protein